jgi:hypothetical protein
MAKGAAAGKGAGEGDEGKTAAEATAAAAAKAAEGAGAGDGTKGAGGAGAGEETPTEKTFTQADIDRATEKAKKDAQKEVDAAAARAKLSEDAQKDARIKDLETSLRMRDARDDVIAALEKEGAKSTGLMWNAIKGDLEFDEKSGKVTNLKDLVKDLKADYADQFGEPKPEGTIEGGAGQQAVAGSGLTKEKLATMSASEIKDLDWEEVKKVMAGK